ncbi:hypothetical protein F5Y18DRAFT_138184 [Xylariaceae sp. FL1019]|nr:hypothetical protein F5Y18DRAFT_138184 [Xylariaceae sp. FL1019]
MARPRKRRRSTSNSDPSVQNKRSKLGKASASHHLGIHHPVISHFYPQVENLRDYVIGKLPSSSRIRRKKVGAVGRFGKSPAVPLSDAEQALGNLLDTTFLGLPNPASSEEDHRQAEWRDFSQKGDESYVTLSNGVSGFVESQHLIVEFVIRSLFKREKSAKWPDHMLCDGFRRNGVLGLRSIRSNPYVEALQQTPWPELLALLGDSGDRIMIDLLLDCAVFLTIDAHTNNVCQVSGKPLSNVCSFGTKSIEVKSNSEVVFVRNRMFYARPALNARGQVQFGLRHIHVLNRAPYHQIDDVDGTSEPRPVHSTHQNEINTFRVMMYMFPRQFGLHNVFTSKVDFKETSQTFKDYTLREEEIAEKFGRLGDVGVKLKIPKRLRGRAIELVRALQVGHQRCSYSQLLHHYCPVRKSRI